MNTPTARSIKYLRDHGFIVAPVEKTIHVPGQPFPFKRDCFGFGDLLICKPGIGTALVQVTDVSNMRHRINKIKGIADDKRDLEKSQREADFAHRNAIAWIDSGNFILVHGWSKRGKKGERKKWTLTARSIPRSIL